MYGEQATVFAGPRLLSAARPLALAYRASRAPPALRDPAAVLHRYSRTMVGVGQFLDALPVCPEPAWLPADEDGDTYAALRAHVEWKPPDYVPLPAVWPASSSSDAAGESIPAAEDASDPLYATPIIVVGGVLLTALMVALLRLLRRRCRRSGPDLLPHRAGRLSAAFDL